jgi:D-glycerate 3-kinase
MAALIAEEKLPPSYAQVVQRVWMRLAGDILDATAARRPLVAGICGAQGSGKSTAVKFLKLLLEDAGARVAVISLDDLYLTREERAALAERVHPLFATRGVPGTHDVGLGHRVLDALTALAPAARTQLPRFDKALDTRAPPSETDVFVGSADIVLFEGWCVGAVPQDEADLTDPINDLERICDPDGVWRRRVNVALAGPYQELFGRLGMLVLLEAPGFEAVLAWRTEQERKLRTKVAATGAASRVMSDVDVAVFIQHYERLTRHILAEMPRRCDVRLELDETRRIVDYIVNDPPSP